MYIQYMQIFRGDKEMLTNANVDENNNLIGKYRLLAVCVLFCHLVFTLSTGAVIMRRLCAIISLMITCFIYYVSYELLYYDILS